MDDLTGLATKRIDGAESIWPSSVTTDHCKHAGQASGSNHRDDLDRKSFETMTGGIHAKAQRDPAAAD